MTNHAAEKLSEALARTLAERDELLQALIHTHEYVGTGMLPAIAGWSWYDAVNKYAPWYIAGLVPAEERRHDISLTYPGHVFHPCEVGQDGRCRRRDHYVISGGSVRAAGVTNREPTP